MSVSQTYPFTTPGNYAFDANKVEMAAGKANLKLADNTGLLFNQDFANDTGFTFDSALAEFVAGVVRQKDLKPTNAIFYASFETNENGNWGDDVLAGSLLNGAVIANNRLDVTAGPTASCLMTGNNNLPEGEGCARFKVIFRDTAVGYVLASVGTIKFHVYRSGPSQFVLAIRNDAGGVFASVVTTIGTITTDVEHEIEVNWSQVGGYANVFIDGILAGSDTTLVGTRTSSSAQFYVGASSTGIDGANAEISDLVIFDAAQHNANYTPGEVISNYVYAESKVELPQFVYTGMGAVQAFTNIITTETGSPKLVINDLYYNSGWIASNGSYAQSNTVAEVLANIATLPASDTVDIDVIFTNDNTTQSDVGDLTLTYTGQLYPVDNPTIVPNTVLRTDDLISLVDTVVKAGSDDIKFTLRVNGVDKYWDGAAWSNSSGYTESNTAAEITTNAAALTDVGIDVLPVIYLHSNDGTTTPEIDLLVITGDFSGVAPGAPEVVSVYGFVYDIQGNPLESVEVTAKLKEKAIYNDEIDVSELVATTTTNVDGYWELNVIETDNMTSGSRYVFLIKGTDWTREYEVQVPSGSAGHRIQDLN